MNLRACELDLTRQLVWRDGATVSLTAAEGRLLAYLVANNGRVVPNDELLEQVWGYRRGVRSRTVATTVRRLREKIEANPAEPDHLLTVYGTGYRFEPLEAAEPPTLLGRA